MSKSLTWMRSYEQQYPGHLEQSYRTFMHPLVSQPRAPPGGQPT